MIIKHFRGKPEKRYNRVSTQILADFFQTAKCAKERKVFWEGLKGEALKIEGGRTAFKKHPWGRFRRAKLAFAHLPFFSFLCASSRPLRFKKR